MSEYINSDTVIRFLIMIYNIKKKLKGEFKMPKNTKKLIAFFLAAVMLVTIVTPSNLWSAFSDSDYTNVVAATSGDAVAKQKKQKKQEEANFDSEGVSLYASSLPGDVGQGTEVKLDDFITEVNLEKTTGETTDKVGTEYDSTGKLVAKDLYLHFLYSLDVATLERALNGEIDYLIYDLPDTMEIPSTSDVPSGDVFGDGEAGDVGDYFIDIRNRRIYIKLDKDALYNYSDDGDFKQNMTGYLKFFVRMNLDKTDDQGKIDNKLGTSDGTKDIIITPDPQPDVSVTKERTGQDIDYDNGKVTFTYTQIIDSNFGTGGQAISYEDRFGFGYNAEVSDITITCSDSSVDTGSIVVTTNKSYDNKETGFKATLPAIGAKQKYTVTYKVTLDLAEAGTGTVNVSDKNTVNVSTNGGKARGEDTTDGSTEYTQKDNSGLKVEKNATAVVKDPENNKITWSYSIKVSVNSATENPLKISDILTGAGIPGAKRTITGLKVTKNDTGDVVDSSGLTISTGDNADANSTIISGELPALGDNEYYIITYDVEETDIPGDTKGYFQNGNKFQAKNGLEKSESSSNPGTNYTGPEAFPGFSKRYVQEVVENGETYIEWSIRLTPADGIQIADIKLTDELFKNGNTESMDGVTVSVKYDRNDSALDASGLKLPLSFVTETDDDGNESYVIIDADGTRVAYDPGRTMVVTYRTATDTPENIKDTYKNVATIEKSGKTKDASASHDITAKLVSKDNLGYTGSDGLYIDSWKTVISGTIKSGDMYEDTLTDADLYVSGKRINYMTAEQARNISLGSYAGGYKIYVRLCKNGSDDWRWITLDQIDSEMAGNYGQCVISAYRIEFTSDSVLPETGLEITYESTTDFGDESGTSTARNNAKFTRGNISQEDNADSTKTEVGSIVDKYVLDKDGNPVTRYDTLYKSGEDNYFEYRVVVDPNCVASGTINITDKIPEGMILDTSFTKSGFKSSNGVSVGIIYKPYGSAIHTSLNGMNPLDYGMTVGCLNGVISASIPESAYNFYNGTSHVSVVLMYRLKLDDTTKIEQNGSLVADNTCVAKDGSGIISDSSAMVNIENQRISKTTNGEYDDKNNEISYKVTVNPDGATLGSTGTINVVDTFDYTSSRANDGKSFIDSITVKPGSLKISVLDESGSVVEELDPSKYSAAFTDSNSTMMATLNFTVPDSTPLLIEYTYTLNYNLDKLTARAFNVENSAYIAGSTADAWNTKDNYSISDDGSSAGFGVTKVNLTLVKKDSIDGLVFLKGAEFALEKYTADGTWTEASLADTSTIVTGEDGTVKITGLDFNYYYRLKETKAPDGYKLPENTYVLIYEADSTKPDVGPKPGFVTDATGPYTDNGVKYTRVHANAGYIYVDNEIANRKISVVKEWKDAAGNSIAAPPVSSVTVDIYKSVNADRYDATEANKVGTATLSADNNWTYTFENLESVDGSGNKLYYFIRETEFNDSNYTTSYSTDVGVVSGTVTITNTKKPVAGEIAVSKAWNDDDDKYGLRPDSVDIVLKQNGVVYKTLELNAANGWAGSFTELPKYDDDGNLYVYTVEEKAVADYAVTTTGSVALGSVKFTNTVTYTEPDKGALQVTKKDADTGEIITDGTAVFGLYTKSGDVYIPYTVNGTAVIAPTVDGVASFTDIPYGTYYVKEEAAPEGYDLNNEYTEAVINSETAVQISVEDTATVYPIRYVSFKFKKTDQAGNALKGAEFKLTIAGTEIVTAASEDDGYVYFYNIPVTDKYMNKLHNDTDEVKITETSAPEGYKLPDEVDVYKGTFADLYRDYSHNEGVVADKTEAAELIVGGNDLIVKNVLMQGEIVVSKKDEKGAVLDGAVFRLYSDADLIHEVAVATTGRLGEAGIARFTGLTYGKTYYLREESAPAGYKVDSTVRKITVGTTTGYVDGTGADGNWVYTYTVNVTDKFDNKDITIDKRNLTDDSRVAGAGLAIYKSDEAGNYNESDRVADGTTTATDNWKLKVGVAGSGSDLVFDQCYVLKEVTTPDGYETAANVVFRVGTDGKVEIISGTTTAEGKKNAEAVAGNTGLVLYDDISLGSIEVTKKDADTQAVITSGTAVFGLYVKNGNAYAPYTVNGTAVKASTVNGVARFTDLPYGTYYVKEESAPAGYDLNTEYKEVVINSKTEVQISVEDTATVYPIEYISLKFKKTDNLGNALLGATFKLTIAGAEVATAASETGGYVYFYNIPVSNAAGNKLYNDSDTVAIVETAALPGYRVPDNTTVYEKRFDEVYASYGHTDTIADKTLARAVTVNGDELTVVNAQEKGAIIIRKYDMMGFVLNGAIFRLYEDQDLANVVAEVKTGALGEDGVARFNDLVYGKTYYVKEYSAPAGYKVSDTVTTVRVGYTTGANEGTDATGAHVYIYNIVVRDEFDYKDITIDKRNLTDNSRVSGAKLGIYKSDEAGNYNESDRVADGTTTATDNWKLKVGVAGSGSDLVFDQCYVLKEVTTPDGYETAANVVFRVGTDGKVEIISGTTTAEGKKNAEAVAGNTGLVLYDDISLGSIEVTKKDADTQAVITSGTAVFGLYVKNGNAYAPYTVNGTAVKASTVNGVARFTDLPYGTYYVKEESAPAGYDLNTEYKEVVINSKTEVQISVEDTLTVYPIEYVSLKFKKTDQAGNALLGANFKLTIAGAEIGTATSETDGYVYFYNIPVSNAAGNKLYNDADEVKITETSAPEGYMLPADTDVYTSTFVDVYGTYKHTNPIADKTLAEAVTVNGDELTVVNVQKKGAIVVRKQDEDGAPLNGAVFKLYSDRDCTVEVATATTGVTGEDGVARFTDLTFGKEYYLKEYSAPAGYKINDSVVTIKIGTTPGAAEAVDGTGAYVYTYNTSLTDDYDNKDITVDKRNLTDDSRVAGAELAIYKSDELGNFSESDQVAAFETTATGNLKLSVGVTGSGAKLVYGQYYVLKEVVTPFGYETAAAVVFKVGTDGKIEIISGTTTQDGKKNAQTVTGDTGLVLYDDISLGSIEVTKKDADTQAVITSGTAVFGLYVKNGNAYAPYTVNGTAVKASTVNGVARFTDLPYGTYYVKEESAPAGYDLNTEYKEVVINSKTEVQISVEDTLTVYPIEYVSLKFKKTDQAGNALLGANFKLTIAGAEIGTAASETDGYVYFYNIPVTDAYRNKLYNDTDEVKITETAAPAGYMLPADTDVYTSTFADIYNDYSHISAITDKTSAREVIVNQEALTVVNTQLVGAIKIEKKDGNGDLLDGATFTIYDDDQFTNVVAEEVTVNGECIFTGLTYGKTYYVKETAAPAGYELDDAVYTVTIGDTGYTESQADSSSPIVLTYGASFTDEFIIEKINVDKQDLNSKAQVKGAGLAVYKVDSDGNKSDEVASWNTDGSSLKEFTVGLAGSGADLIAGEYYILSEVNAPKGYYPADDILFTVDINGNIVILGGAKNSRNKDNGAVKNKTLVMYDETKRDTDENTTEITTETTTETSTEVTTETSTEPGKPDKPGKPTNPDKPKTGDNTPLAGAVVILFVSMGITGGLIFKKKKEKSNS